MIKTHILLLFLFGSENNLLQNYKIIILDETLIIIWMLV